MKMKLIYIAHILLLTITCTVLEIWCADLSFDIKPAIENSALQKQETILIQSIKNEPENIVHLMALTQFYYIHRYYPQSISILDHIIQLNPTAHQAYYLLGKILGSQKSDPERSLANLNQAVKLAPDSIEYLEELVNVYHRLERYPPALKHLETILQIEPDNIDAIYRKAVILHTQGHVAQASNLIKNTTHEHSLVLQALIKHQQGETPTALYERILEKYPKNIRARYEYGKLLIKQRKTDDAQELFEKIIDDDPFYQHALFQLVKIYSIKRERNKVKLAKQSLDTINRMGKAKRNFYRSYLRHHPDTAETHFEMGLIYLEIGRGDLAAEEMKRTLELEQTHPEAQFYLAQIYMSSGDFQTAITYLKQCLEFHENKAVIHSLLTQCYLESNNVNEAHKHLKAALKINPQEPLANRILSILKQNASKKD